MAQLALLIEAAQELTAVVWEWNPDQVVLGAPHLLLQSQVEREVKSAQPCKVVQGRDIYQSWPGDYRLLRRSSKYFTPTSSSTTF